MATASTPHYVAQKVGDQYKLVRVDTVMGSEHPGAFIGGIALSVCGLWYRGTLGWLAALGGAGLAYYGLTGHNLLDEIGLSARPKFDTGPSYQHEDDSSRQTPQDEVDEASMESFPASDPPAATAAAARPTI